MDTQSIRSPSLPGDLFSSENPQAPHIREMVRAQGESYKHATIIDMLTDDVLLEIFDFCRKSFLKDHQAFADPLVWKWDLLAHVCRRWRQIILDSPRRLKLQILCTDRTLAEKDLGIWPALPIIINSSPISNNADNLIAALDSERLRVSFVEFSVTGTLLGKIATVMQEPFPLLKHLHIDTMYGGETVLPAEFLGGSAPCLRTICLSSVPYPALPTLLASASGLVKLVLHYISATGYVSPEAMVASLAALPKLKEFWITFDSASLRPDRIHLAPVTRIVLPALTSFQFAGASEYLENLIAHIDSPRLDWIRITYTNQLAGPQLSRFVDRSIGPKLSLHRHVQVHIYDSISFSIYRHADRPSYDWHYKRPIISFEGDNWTVSDMARVFNKFSTTLSNGVYLNLESMPYLKPWVEEALDDTDRIEWVHLFQQFSAVRTLHVSETLAEYVARALEGEAATEVLPSLDLICLVDQPASSVGKFVAARELSGHPVAVVNTETEFNLRLDSYISQ